jgi:hypothetical protein
MEKHLEWTILLQNLQIELYQNKKKTVQQHLEQRTSTNKVEKGLLIKLPKKENLKECKNWRGIILLPVMSKILGTKLIDRITDGLDDKLRKEQAGFRSGRRTTEQIFILRNITEQVNEWQATL